MPELVYDIVSETVVKGGTVVEGETVSFKPKYLVISHRWNNTEGATETFPGVSWKCQLSNIIKLKAAIPIAKIHSINYIWIDGICVNQEKIETDIYDMYSTYKHSKVTLVMIDIDKVHEQQIKDERAALITKFTAFKSIMNHDWWNRIWTLQEMLISQNKLLFINLSTGNTICTFEEYRSLYNYYKTQDDYNRQLSEHEVNTRVYDNKALSAREVMAMCKNRRSTKEEDCAWGITGILNLNMTFRYGIGKQRALKRLAKYLAKKGDITFLDYWGPCGNVSYIPIGYEEYKLVKSPDNSCQQQFATISEAGLNLQVYSPTELTRVKTLKKCMYENMAKHFVTLGENDYNLYKGIIRTINPNCDPDSYSTISKLVKSHYRKIKYSNADTICDILEKSRLLEGYKEIFQPNIENQTFFLADINNKIFTIGCIYTADLNLIAEYEKLQLFIVEVPQISFPFVTTRIKNNTYKIVGRIKSKTKISYNEIVNITIQ